MEVKKALKLDKITYDCKCRYCETKVSAEQDELVWDGGLHLAWTCPICCMRNRESIFSLMQHKVDHYVVVDIKKDGA